MFSELLVCAWNPRTKGQSCGKCPRHVVIARHSHGTLSSEAFSTCLKITLCYNVSDFVLYTYLESHCKHSKYPLVVTYDTNWKHQISWWHTTLETPACSLGSTVVNSGLILGLDWFIGWAQAWNQSWNFSVKISQKRSACSVGIFIYDMFQPITKQLLNWGRDKMARIVHLFNGFYLHSILSLLWCDGTSHDDVIKWKHSPRYWPFVQGIHRSRVNTPHKGQWRRDLMFSLICAWINGWVNNGEAGDLRRHRAHYHVTVMMALHFTQVRSQKSGHLLEDTVLVV